MELLTDGSACKSFSNKASLYVCSCSGWFSIPFLAEGRGNKRLPLSALPARLGEGRRGAALADARLPTTITTIPSLQLLALYGQKGWVGFFFFSPSASDYCDHSKKSRQNG